MSRRGFAGDRTARIDGLLVAGGRAVRFGSDKRRALLAGTTLAERSLALLRETVDGDVLVAGRGAFDHPVSATFVDDAARGAGPLGGLVGALLRVRFGVVVMPCDAPLVRNDTLRSLALLGRRTGRIVVVRSPRGIEPLVAFYPRRALPFLAAGLREGSRALHRLVVRAGALTVGAASSREMHNVNRLSDLDSIA